MINLIISQATIVCVMWMLIYTLKFKKKMKNKSLSPFECGYNMFFTKLPLSIQFSMLVFMFLLFDIELSILISSNWAINPMNKYWIDTMIIFFILMIISIIYEMLKKAFKWD